MTDGGGQKMVSRWKVRYIISPEKSNVCFWEIHFSLSKPEERNHKASGM